MAIITFLAAIQTVQKPLHGTNSGQNIACLMLFGGELPNNSFGEGFGKQIYSVRVPNLGSMYPDSLRGGRGPEMQPTFLYAHLLSRNAQTYRHLLRKSNM